MPHMGTGSLSLPEDRRDSVRILTRLHVRGLGGDRQWTEQLGNLALGGVGFEFPREPEASRYRVAFNCPGERQLRSAVADVIDYDPIEDSGYFVRLRFSQIDFEDERALARSFDGLLRI